MRPNIRSFRPVAESLSLRVAPSNLVVVPVPIPGLGGPIPPIMYVVLPEPGDVPPPPSVGG